MKKFLIALIVFATAFVSYANAQYLDKADIPAPVSQQFSSQYASVTAPDWQKTGGKFTVSFKTDADSVLHKLVYAKDGAMVSHQYTIPLSSLPAEVSGSMEKNFADLKISAADKIEEEGKVRYQVTLGDSVSPVKVLTSDKGAIIRTTMPDNQ